MPAHTLKEVVLVPGLDEKIRHLAAHMFGEDSREEDLSQLVSQLLPILVGNALAGDVPVESDPDSIPVGPVDKSIADAVARATEQVESADPSQESLEVHMHRDEEGRTDQKPDVGPKVSFEELEATGEVNPKAIAWAKGNPLKEQALAETCDVLHPSCWSWVKVLELAERTYDMKSKPIGGSDENDVHKG